MPGIGKECQNSTLEDSHEQTETYRTPAFIWSSPILGHLQISR